MSGVGYRSSGETILADLEGGVLEVRFNRQDRMNAWNSEMEREYFDVLTEADADPEVRAIVVTGEGRGFCPGADFEDLGGISDGSGSLESRERGLTFPLEMRKPLIAAINGACAGIGLLQALCCDVRFVAAEAKLTTAFARRGLIAEEGLTVLLARAVGVARATELLISGRVVTGEEAERIGLVHRSCESDSLVEEAVVYARDLAENCSPRAIANIKAQIREDLHGDLDRARERADRLLQEAVKWPDFTEGIASFEERRPPEFPPLR